MKKKHIALSGLLLLVMLVTVTFEAAQQLFYMKRYQINNEATLWSLFQSHLYRWLVWLLYSYFLLRFVKGMSERQQINFVVVLKLVLVIMSLVVTSILTIALIAMMNAGLPFDWTDFWQEWVLFFTFQKAPIYTLAYVCFAVICYYYFWGQNLKIEMLKVDELNQEQRLEFDSLKARLEGAKEFLNIKVGRKQHLVPVTDVYWIEADNYCVNVYTQHITPYALRTSLKALEKQLPVNFIRVHRKAIVNMLQVVAFKQNGHFELELSDGTVVSVASSRADQVRSYINPS